MQRIILFLAFGSLPLFFMAGCRKEQNRQFRVSFYASQQDQALNLYLDGQPMGQLPYLKAEPDCAGSGADVLAPLVFTLSSGEHTLVAKDAQGVVHIVGTLRLTASTTGTSGTAGGVNVSRSGDCVAVGLWR